VATQFSDMALGGESGFAAGYTPIRFAPLVSLTGPIQGPATPTATAPAEPAVQPLRLPMMGGMAEMPDNAYMTGQAGAYPEGMPPIGARSGEQIRGDLMNIGGFFMSPIGSMLNYAMTGQTPAQAMQEMFGGAQGQQGQQGQGMFGGLRDFLFGQQQSSVPLGEMRAPLSAGGEGMGGAVFGDAEAIARSMGLGDERAAEIGRTAMGLLSQGLDPVSAVTLATNYGAYATRPDAETAMQSTPTPNLDALNQAIMQRTSTMEQFGPQQTAGGYAPSDFGGYGGGVAGETGSPGESSYGLDR
jgi:hypothetical protein